MKSLLYRSVTGHNASHFAISVHRPYGKFIPYYKYFDAFENIVKRVGGRPHWGKVRLGSISASCINKGKTCYVMAFESQSICFR